MTSLVQYERIHGQQQRSMRVKYACGFNQLETGKYFERIIMHSIDFGIMVYEQLSSIK